MKVLPLSLVLGMAVLAQSPAATDRPAPGTPASAPPASPATKPPTLGAAAPVSPDTVVAKVGGKDYTAAEMDKLLSELPPQFQVAIARQPQLITNMFMLRNLAEQAEKENLDKEPRYQQQLEYQRMSVLAQAAMNHFRESITIKPEDLKAYYDRNTDQFRVATVKAIYITYAPTPKTPAPSLNGSAADTKKPAGRTEEEAKAKAEDLRKQILAGADFSKLAS